MELVLNHVSKKYQGKTVVNGINATLTSGVTGLLGANGAGKTTLMRMICGILNPTRGTIRLDGINASEEIYRDVLGYLPQDFGYYPSFTGYDFLMYMAALKGLEKSAAKLKCDELLSIVNLKDSANKKIKTYSGGMKQRLGIAQALLNDPKLIVLDEPTAGLDPKERVHFRNMISELGNDAIVLLSTHIVSDVSQIADRIIMIDSGKLIWDGGKQDIPGDLESFYIEKFGGNENE